MQIEVVRGTVLRSKGNLEPPPGYGGISVKVDTLGEKSSKEGCERTTGFKCTRYGGWGVRALGSWEVVLCWLTSCPRLIEA